MVFILILYIFIYIFIYRERERLYIQLWLCFNLGDRAPIRIQKSQVPPHRPLQPPILALPHRRLLRRLRHRCRHCHHPWQYWMLCSSSAANKWSCLGAGFKYFWGEDFQFDEYFSIGLKPPTSCVFEVCFCCCFLLQHLGGFAKANAAGSQCLFSHSCLWIYYAGNPINKTCRKLWPPVKASRPHNITILFDT